MMRLMLGEMADDVAYGTKVLPTVLMEQGFHYNYPIHRLSG